MYQGGSGSQPRTGGLSRSQELVLLFSESPNQLYKPATPQLSALALFVQRGVAAQALEPLWHANMEVKQANKTSKAIGVIFHFKLA